MSLGSEPNLTEAKTNDLVSLFLEENNSYHEKISPYINYLQFLTQNPNFSITTFNEEKVKDFL